MSYAFTPVPDAAYVVRLRDSLKPGGLLVFEHYTSEDQKDGTIRRGEATKVFRDFKILRYDEPVTRGDFAFRLRSPLVQIVATR